MTLNGVMAVTLRYSTEFGKHAFQHITAASICGGIYAQVLYFVSRARCRRKESSRSLSHLLMSFLYDQHAQTPPLCRSHYVNTTLRCTVNLLYKFEYYLGIPRVMDKATQLHVMLLAQAQLELLDGQALITLRRIRRKIRRQPRNTFYGTCICPMRCIPYA